MADKNEKPYFFCIMEQKDCAACYNGICLALEDADFKGHGCPFYKTVEQQAEENADTIRHLVDIGRFDLIEKFRGKQVANKYGR